jgi:CheY-like chemotaxis protein
MNAMADTGQIRLALKCYAAPEAIYFDADPDRMLQVLTNLLSNAIKFSPPETTVTIEIDADEELLTLKVVDRGRGIPDDKLECIFDRFQQVENADASKKGGTGLGLAICRSIVQQHGGMIWAQSNKSGAVSHKTAMQTSQNGSSANHNGVHPSGNGAASGRTETRETFGGAGTTFCLQFKRCPRTGDTALPTGVTSLIDRGVGLILVCDDDAGVRTVVSEQLRQQGYDVIEAGSGEEVIALTQEQATQNTALPEISAVLLDLHLPGISGWETLRQMKSTVGPASIPTIILSVVPPTQRLLQTGYASGWVQKPFNSNLLLAELAKVLQSESHAAAGGEAKSVAMPVV